MTKENDNQDEDKKKEDINEESKSILNKLNLSSENEQKSYNVLVVTHSTRNCIDLRRYLAALFISKEKELKYFTQKLYFYTSSYQEVERRCQIIQNPKTPAFRKVETILLHQLNFCLKHRNQKFYEGIDNF